VSFCTFHSSTISIVSSLLSHFRFLLCFSAKNDLIFNCHSGILSLISFLSSDLPPEATLFVLDEDLVLDLVPFCGVTTVLVLSVVPGLEMAEFNLLPTFDVCWLRLCWDILLRFQFCVLCEVDLKKTEEY
jgi:hypothetical protein